MASASVQIISGKHRAPVKENGVETMRVFKAGDIIKMEEKEALRRCAAMPDRFRIFDPNAPLAGEAHATLTEAEEAVAAANSEAATAKAEAEAAKAEVAASAVRITELEKENAELKTKAAQK